ncbi:MAG TPA: TadE/TadG family type IV pilus assembly protein [Rhizomicrobium sp.]|nr:TadE/TadG family type IV pilus assembly protein [Rhizomicrobium sp.]
MRHLSSRHILRDVRGTTAVEMAFLAPVFFMIIIGVVNIALLMFTVGSMHFAVESAARCASVNSGTCSSASSITSYAKSKYYGALIAPAFSSATAACGQSVTATATYVLNSGVAKYSIPLSATACYP